MSDQRNLIVRSVWRSLLVLAVLVIIKAVQSALVPSPAQPSAAIIQESREIDGYVDPAFACMKSMLDAQELLQHSRPPADLARAKATVAKAAAAYGKVRVPKNFQRTDALVRQGTQETRATCDAWDASKPANGQSALADRHFSKSLEAFKAAGREIKQVLNDFNKRRPAGSGKV